MVAPCYLLSTEHSPQFQWLALIVLAQSIPLVALCLRFEDRYKSLARSAQDQVGDLATTVEESVLGIRILKAFGRSAQRLAKLDRGAICVVERKVEVLYFG